MFHAIPHFVCYPQARKIHLNNATSNIIIGLSAREGKLRIHSTPSAAFFVFARQIIFYHGRQTRLSLNENQPTSAIISQNIFAIISISYA